MERNKFLEMTQNELITLYEQYCSWNKTGVIADDAELRKMADIYVEMYDVHGLHIMELDLLKAIAKHWHNKTPEASPKINTGVKVSDFLSQWSGSFTIEDKSGAIYGEFRENLSEELLNKEITDINIYRSMWTGKNGNVSLIIAE